MLVYDITNHKTFENISKWLRNIDEVRTYIKYDKLSISKKKRDIHIDAHTCSYLSLKKYEKGQLTKLADPR